MPSSIQQLVSCLALRAIPQSSPPPISCAENKKHTGLIIYVLAVYDFHFRSIPFQELRLFLTLTPDTSLHFHSNHTLQHPTASVVSA